MRIGVWLRIGLLVSLGTSYAFAAPVPIELFDSQGCSSCPPAEKALQELENEFGADVLPLDFHVDYWDRLGWKDTFSSAEATARQRYYAKALRQAEMYTPEMVIQGHVGFVGSDRQQARNEVEKRLKQPSPELALQAKGSLASSSLTVSFQLPDELAAQKPSVTVVVYENADPVHVKKGENAGALMSGRYAVREFWTIPERISPAYQIPIQLKPAWNAEKTGVAILVQAASSDIVAASRYFPLSAALHP